MPFNLSAKFGMDARGFQQGLRGAEDQVKASSEKMAGTLQNAFSGNGGGGLFKNLLVGAGLGAMGEFASSLAEKVTEKFKEISIGSTLLQVDPQTFQRVQNVTEATFSSAETVAKAFEHIAEAQEKVKAGGAEGLKATENFAKLGVSLAQIQSKSFQDIFFQIAASLQATAKAGDMAGDTLTALKATMGRGGPGLLPAFAKGFEGPAAEKGILDEGQLKSLQQLKDISTQTGGVWKDMANTAGIFFAKIYQGVKTLPLLPGLIKDMRSESAADSEQNTHAKLNEKIIADRDAAKAAGQAERDQAAANAKINQEFARKQAEEEQARAIKDNDKLQEEVSKREEEVDKQGRSPEQQKKFLRERVAKEKELSDEYAQRYRDNPDDATLQREALGHKLKMLDAAKEVNALETKGGHGAAEFRIEDRLARLGGGFAAADQSLKPIHERTARAAEELVRMGRSGQTNPFAGI